MTTTSRNIRDARFVQLIDLANTGDEAAVHDLWTEYQHDFKREGDPRDQLPPRKMTETKTPTKEI